MCVCLQEVCRIRNEHPDDPSAISKDRVKGSLKVTRAFGAGFLKQVSLCLIFFSFTKKRFCLDGFGYTIGTFMSVFVP